ncbi:MAG: hypothetical protein IID45_09910, partial [Planctomycetes bacterium]|nr:hypothetical protein [Planctomycetota bacterium]
MRGDDSKASLRTLIVFGGISWCLYAAIAWLSQWYGVETPGTDRPILAVCGLLGMLSIAYLAALRAAVRLEGHRELLATILVFAAAFRATLLLTEPFQEIDLYRYVWDGQTTVAGVSPFRYSPLQVRTAQRGKSNDEDLSKLVRLRDGSSAVGTILSRVHFAELPTAYPPTSQAVFALAALTTPHDSDVATHLVVIKSWILLFDFGVLWGLIAILRLTGKPIGWAVAYGWCPLVIKEFANSGHLDSISVCLTTWAVYFLLRGLFEETLRSTSSWRWTMLSAAMLAFAVGAKLYPVVLVPLFAIATVRKLGWKPVIGSAAVFSVIVLILAAPFRPLGDPATVGVVQLATPSKNARDHAVIRRPADFDLQPPVPQTPSDSVSPSPLDATLPPIVLFHGTRSLQPPIQPVEGDTSESPGNSRTRFSTGDPQSGLRAFL